MFCKNRNKILFEFCTDYFTVLLTSYSCTVASNNISVILWQSVLLVKETGENHPPGASH